MAEKSARNPGATMTRIYQTLDMTNEPRFPSQPTLHSEVDALVARKQEVLRRQQRMSNRANAKLTTGGKCALNEVARMTCKNTEAAITASRRPGVFPYYEAPADVAAEVAKGELQTTLRKMMRIQGELEEVDAEYNAAMAKKKATLMSQNAPQPKSLKEWFSHYGRPQMPEGPSPGWKSATGKSKKIYGGTGHHRAFRTQVVIMKPGRLTR